MEKHFACRVCNQTHEKIKVLRDERNINTSKAIRKVIEQYVDAQFKGSK